MSLVKRNDSAFPMFNTWVDNIFNKGEGILRSPENSTTRPAVNVSETDASYELELAVPGMNKEDLKIEIENGALCISSESETTKESDNKNYTRKEYSFESFYRSFSLPENVDDSSIAASYNEGVLKIVLPKSETSEQESKSIAIS